MQYYAYHTEQQSVLEQLDAEFDVVTVVGGPEDNYSDGYDLAIYDTRSKEEISRTITKIHTKPGREV